MCMQLIKNIGFGGILFLFAITAFAQSDKEFKLLDPIEIDLISNYYLQDGNHSPVNGGEGTEKLDVITESIQINIPVKKEIKIALNGGVEFFSSASQNGNGGTTSNNNEGENDERRSDDDDDDDDDEYTSGASQYGGKVKRDKIVLFGVGLSKEILKKNMEIGGNAGFYKDGNVTSSSLGFSFSKSTKDNNNTIGVDFHHYRDLWNVIYPAQGETINGTEHLADNIRHTFSTSLSYTRVINKKLVGAVMVDIVYQKGMLNTPYHRVYFSDQELPAVERLPTSRLKIPIGLRLNYHASDIIILRTFYRFYFDNWGIKGNTFSLEMPIKAASWLRVYPFYRFHTQTAAKHFEGFKQSISSETFYTADYDLSAVNTHKFGVGFSVAPVNGLLRTKGSENRAASMFKSLDFRYAYYTRNDGLTGHMITAGLKFNIGRKR